MPPSPSPTKRILATVMTAVASLVPFAAYQAPAYAADTTRPTVYWVTPAANATVSGYLFDAATSGPSGPCAVKASDNVGVKKVNFYTVNGAFLNQETAAPWNCKLDTTKLTDGTHTLKAIAYDAAGNNTVAQRTVTVKNAPTPTPTPTPDPDHHSDPHPHPDAAPGGPPDAHL